MKGHGIRLDVLAKDAKGVYYDIEVQRSDEGATPKRARYNSSLIDANVLKKGYFVEEIAEVTELDEAVINRIKEENLALV